MNYCVFLFFCYFFPNFKLSDCFYSDTNSYINPKFILVCSFKPTRLYGEKCVKEGASGSAASIDAILVFQNRVGKSRKPFFSCSFLNSSSFFTSNDSRFGRNLKKNVQALCSSKNSEIVFLSENQIIQSLPSNPSVHSSKDRIPGPIVLWK